MLFFSLRLCAVSRCYRAEVSGSEAEGKLYRLHEFTKVKIADIWY
jgi:seryl-tRNA synthetase